MRSETSSERVDFERQLIRRSLPSMLMSSGTARAFRVLEQQRGPAGARDAVGDLGDFEHRVHFGGDALEFAALFQARDELAQVLVGHAILPAIARRLNPPPEIWSPGVTRRTG